MSAALVDIAGLDVRFGEQRAVAGVDLTLAAGEVVGVVGESGSGKSLLARSLLGLLPHGAQLSADRLRFDGQDLTSLDARSWQRLRGARIGLVLQEPLTSLNPALRVGEQLAEGLRVHKGVSRREALLAAARALEQVRMDDPAAALRRYPHEFSGGQRQRILIASTLLLEPRLIIADEPATALDALVGDEILDLIGAQASRLGAAVLMISHDLSQVARRAERIVVMERGAVVDSGPTSQVFLQPSHPYTRRLLEAIPRRGEPLAAPVTGAPVLAARGLVLDYAARAALPFLREPSRRALDDVGFELRAGETLAVIGESGSGKSSLAMLALGLRDATGGTLEVEGRSWASRSGAERRKLRRRVQVVFQDPAGSLDPRMQVGDLIGEGLRELPAAERAVRVRKVLDEVGLGGEFAGRCPHQLSGGQRQRVAIARALVPDPGIVIADEPVSALDVTVQAQILELLVRLKRERGFALLFVTHDLGVVERIADRVMVMRNGRVVESGTLEQVFNAPRQAYTRQLLSIAPVLVAEGAGFRLEARSFATAVEGATA
ncbi:MAG: ABC transporter ATP-binding protein [Gammaproteobacteria bacterium]|nr:ABC transporter ATP-binding protein [Gammaproteobacteria bacterium]